jgi:hypothetical protein
MRIPEKGVLFLKIEIRSTTRTLCEMLEFLWFCLVAELDPTQLVLEEEWGQFVEFD